MGDGDDDAVNVKYYPLLSASALLLRDANGCVEESEEIKTTKASTSSSSGKPSTSSEFDGYAQVTTTIQLKKTRALIGQFSDDTSNEHPRCWPRFFSNFLAQRFNTPV